MHIPVLQKEVLEYLDPGPNENFIDCTIGEGGHTLSVLKKNAPRGKVLGIEWDSELYKKLLKRKIQRLILINDSFSNLNQALQKNKIKINGILFDLGLSSWHIEESGRGFSFKRREKLDMRYNLKNPLTAEKILNYWSASEIEKILKEYGEERFASIIVKNIIQSRGIKMIETTFQLVDIIKKSIPRRYQHQHIHPATRTFQALRIAVNDELNNLKKGLYSALDVIQRGGRLVAISFHSLEDRVIKNFLKENQEKGFLKILTKNPVTPSQIEIKENPRSRSAKLRAAVKI